MEIGNSFSIDDEIDNDGFIEIEIIAYEAGFARQHINKDQAQKIVDHLTKVFELKDQ